MIVFPNCKINLGLNILGKRADGFHNLETVFYPIQLKDALEIIPNSKTENSESAIEFTSSGFEINGNENDNLCIRAYHLLKNDFPELLPIKMHLHKVIPMGAGLGGGSADAAFTLKLLNEKFNLNLSVEQLCVYALQLGSDCPFFIANKSCIATSRGEILNEVSLDLSNYNVVLINPGIHINTAWAFAQLNGTFTKTFIHKNIFQSIENWKDLLINDFEKPVFEKYPSIKDIKETLYDQGAIFASMSGSGSTVYGLFDKNKKINQNIFAGCFTTTLSL